MQYAKITVSISHKDVDRTFSYKIPEDIKPLIKLGQSVTVPFGRGNKPYEGYVTGFSDDCSIDDEKVKEIIRINNYEQLFDDKMLKLAEWMQQKYYTNLYECLKCVIPKGNLLKSDVLITFNENIEIVKPTEKQAEIIEYLKAQDCICLKTELENNFYKSIDGTLKTLEKKGIISYKSVTEYKNLTLKMKFAYINYENEVFEDVSDIEKTITELTKKSKAQAKVLSLLLENDGMAVSDIKKFLNISNSPVESLVKSNLIKTEDTEILRNTVNYTDMHKKSPPALSQEQQAAVDFIESKQDNKPVLIHGITGSGKTEIYMRIIEKAINDGKQAIMLVPEISLTAQTVNVFLSRFGDLVSVTHSRLTLGERYDQWKKAKSGQASIIIGPRSAIFAPFENLGAIIIDEEHEKTYKSETTPKYCAKEVAIQRGALSNALVVFGSATPCVETYFKATSSIFDLVVLKERINKTLPEIYIADMRKELEQGNMSIFSAALYKAIGDNLNKNEQTILFLNRRGFSTFVSCRKCGYVMTCESCNVNYTYHMAAQKLICHYCGKKTKNPLNCPQCGSKYIKYFGVGTQRVEEDINKYFPDAKTLRMDMDTTTGKHTHDHILSKFRNGDANILIGTQMIAKGLDFPNVTLVGIIAADLSLNNGDFRAGETTYQLLTQVSGRAGRAEISGKVFIQTYNPEHYSIIYAKDNNYEEFYSHELSIRRQMNYPPFFHVFCVLIVSQDEKKTIMTLFKLLEIMNFYNRKGLFEILGPSPAVISKIKNKFRWKLIIKSIDEEKLKSFVFYCVDKLKEKEDLGGLQFNLTMNPTLII